MLGIKKKDLPDVQKEMALVKNQLAVLLLHAPLPTLLLDNNLRVTAFNDPAARLFKNVQGRKLFKGISCGQPLEDLLQPVKFGRSVLQTLDTRDSHGNQVHLRVTSSPMFDEDGHFQTAFLSIEQLSTIEEDNPQVKKLQDLVKAFSQTVDLGIALVDENGFYTKTNDGFNHLFGYEKGELDGKHYSINISMEVQANSLNTFLSGNCTDDEWLGIKKNGHFFTLFISSRQQDNADYSKCLVVTARELSEARRYKQIIFNSQRFTHLASWEMDISTRKIIFSPEIYKILELGEPAFRQLSNDDLLVHFLDKEHRQLLDSAIKDAIQEGKPFNLELPVITWEKRQKWISFSCIPERFISRTLKLEGTIHDITKRKSNEFEIERLSLVASKTSNAVFITDKKGLTIWLNESVTRITGYDLAEFIGQKPGEVLQGKDTDRKTIERIRKAIKSRKPVSEIILNYKKDGTPIWINMDIVPVIKNGKVENFIGIGVDITEIVNAREARKIKENLEQQQKLFNAIANNYPDGIIGLLDHNLKYIFAGGSEITKLGLTVNDFIGRKIFDHLGTRSNIETSGQLNKALAGENVAFEVTLNGETYSIIAVPARLGEKDDNHILVVLHNITLHKKAEFELIETLKKEKELGELKTRFVSMASHEFRTPLSTVLSSAYLIEKYTSAEEQPNRLRHLRRIVSSVEMLTEILEDFLSLGKIEEGKIQVRYSTFNIGTLVAVTISEMKHLLKPKQQIIYWHHGEKDINLDKSLLKHILMNLISNASKFSPDDSQIEINTFQDENLVILSVKDHGIGISKQDQQHLMERFFRGANAGNIKGTGLGLHIISKYTELMNGNVVWNSELESGTTFIITFYTKLNQHEENPAN